jgi:lipopolysaccharide/colanic/teichoic acid biosynthesis glycosyltransferase
MPMSHIERANRVLDLILAVAGLVVLGPLMALIALAIRLESRGPIFFAQTRLGRGGRPFRIYKFRKFRPEIGKFVSNGLPLTMSNDSRMSRIGGFLARTKLDELPQLYNILKGDMSFVGPRPESLEFAGCFLGAYRQVLNHKPGIFGPSQVAFRNESSYLPPTEPERFYRNVLFPLKARTDLAYYPRRTVAADLGWILRGALAVVGFDYGPGRIGATVLAAAIGHAKHNTE